MPALVIFCLDEISDPDGLQAYRVAGRPTMGAYDATFVAGPNVTETLEGAPFENVVVVQFETIEKARAWYRSPEYQAVIQTRLAATKGRAFIIETR